MAEITLSPRLALPRRHWDDLGQTQKLGLLILMIILGILSTAPIWLAFYKDAIRRCPRVRSNLLYRFLALLAFMLMVLFSPLFLVLFLLIWFLIFIGLCCMFLGMSCSLLTNALCGWKLPCHPETNGLRGLSLSLRSRLKGIIRLQNKLLRPKRVPIKTEIPSEIAQTAPAPPMAAAPVPDTVMTVESATVLPPAYVDETARPVSELTSQNATAKAKP